MADINMLLRRLRAHWAQADAVVSGVGAPPAALDAFERERGVRLPADVRAYFAAVNGMAPESHWDAELIRFWPFSEVRTVVDELEHQEPVPSPAGEYYVFADYSIWCDAFAVRLTADPGAPSPVVAVYGGDRLVPVAPSLADFLNVYLGPAAHTVLHPPSERPGAAPAAPGA